MNCITNIENAIVIDKEFRGEASLYLKIFSPEFGLNLVMKKVSEKKTSHLPDIFDDVNITVQSASTNSLKFLQDFEIVKRRNSIATSYESFCHASEIVALIAKNGENIEDSRTLANRLKKVLNALADGAPPNIAHMKFLYLLIRDEGYPIIEDFFAGLSPQKKDFFALMIKSPIADLKEFETRCQEVLAELSCWIFNNTDFIEP